MRLNKSEIDKISSLMIKHLTEKNILVKTAKQDNTKSIINNVIYDDMLKEEKLNEEVKNIMESYESELKSGKVDYNKLFNMIKHQLIKERKLVI